MDKGICGQLFMLLMFEHYCQIVKSYSEVHIFPPVAGSCMKSQDSRGVPLLLKREPQSYPTYGERRWTPRHRMNWASPF